MEVYTVSLQENPVGEMEFLPFLTSQLETAKSSLLEEGGISPVLVVLRGEDSADEAVFVPVEDSQDTNSFLQAVAKYYKGAVGYLYYVESWGIQIPADSPLAESYGRSAAEFFDNPFKTEMISFEAQGFGQHYAGVIHFERDDVGKPVVGREEFVSSNTPSEQGEILADMLMK